MASLLIQTAKDELQVPGKLNIIYPVTFTSVKILPVVQERTAETEAILPCSTEMGNLVAFNMQNN